MKRLLFVFLLVYHVSYSQVNLSKGLIVYYPFSGNANDSSGHSLNGTISNATLTIDRKGIEKNAFYFNGRNSCIKLPYSNLLNFSPQDSFSISVWLQPDPGNSWPAQAIVVKSPATSDYTVSQWNYGVYVLNYKAMTGYAYNHVLTGKTILSSSSCWYNIISIYKNGAWKLFVNGILEKSNNSSVNLIEQDGYSKIVLGKKGESNGDWYKGKMDEVRIYHRVLSKEEILAIANDNPCSIIENPCKGEDIVSAKFKVDIQACMAATVELKDKKSSDIRSTTWSFGDGTTSDKFSPTHAYKKPGTYTIRSLVISKKGCADTVEKTIVIPAFKTDFIVSEQGYPGSLLFKPSNNNANYDWDFGDGSTLKNDLSPSHTYPASGTYTAKMIASNKLGCTATITKEINVLLPDKVLPGTVVTTSSSPVQAAEDIRLERRMTDITRKIIIDHDSITVAIYDNGIIDGDSVTILFNNQAILTHQLLKARPFILQLAIDPTRESNELSMYAENLGSIPPNTSLMIITDGEKKYEVNLTSTKSSNGTVCFTRRQ